ncbi:MAG: hypothetical protein GY757_04060 [bacterium]|nr:hypothetical protein [bacterium]
MEEKVYDVEMMYIQNASEKSYTIEVQGRRGQNVKLNFTDVESVEFDAHNKPLEIKNSYLRMDDGQPKSWNLRFTFPTNFKIKYVGKIVIETI